MDRYLRLKLPTPVVGKWALAPANNRFAAGVDAHRVMLNDEALRNAQAGYFGLINHIDDQLYWVIGEFKRKSENCGRPWVVLFISDHGEMLGDHYYFRKCEPYEGSSRIPLLIQASKKMDLKENIVFEHPVCLEDVMPTLLEMAKIDIPDHVDGRSLLPALRGNADELRPYLHAEHSPCYARDQAYHFVVNCRYKFIWRPLTGDQQLFDLRNDPNEIHDLISDPAHASEASRLRSCLAKHLAQRPEGFSDGTKLICVEKYESTIPNILSENALCSKIEGQNT